MSKALLKLFSGTDMLFSIRTHTWLKRCGGNIARLGLTARGLEEVGSIDQIIPLVNTGDQVTKNTPIVEIDWTAYKISAADELYHCAWANIEGSYTIEGPVSCTLRSIHHNALSKPQDICEKTWLVEIELNEEEPLPSLLDKKSYDEHISEIDPGIFADQLI
mgnify:FL=1|tara:strand:- start:130 stop:615 length:486 start_codon:yes stop_codon:yes gene_type:complete